MLVLHSRWTALRTLTTSTSMCRYPHESGWCVSAFRGGLLVWENPDDDSVPPGEIGKVARGDSEDLQASGVGGHCSGRGASLAVTSCSGPAPQEKIAVM
jgi:hypothetical protein